MELEAETLRAEVAKFQEEAAAREKSLEATKGKWKGKGKAKAE